MPIFLYLHKHLTGLTYSLLYTYQYCTVSYTIILPSTNLIFNAKQ